MMLMLTPPPRTTPEHQRAPLSRGKSISHMSAQGSRANLNATSSEEEIGKARAAEAVADAEGAPAASTPNLIRQRRMSIPGVTLVEAT